MADFEENKEETDEHSQINQQLFCYITLKYVTHQDQEFQNSS